MEARHTANQGDNLSKSADFRQPIAAGLLIRVTFGALIALVSASPALATVPVSASIDLETYARRCPAEGCDHPATIEITDVVSESHPNPLAVLTAMSQAVAGNPSVDAFASTSLSMNANFSSASTGSLGFSGTTSIGRPSVAFDGSCSSQNNLSDGLEYVFVADTDGQIEIDYDFECTNLQFISALGEMRFYLDEVLIGRESVNDSQSMGTINGNISAGETHTLRITPDLAGVGGGCINWAWTCEGSASWSIDSAPPVPVPAPAATGAGFVLITFSLLGIGARALGSATASSR